MEPSSARESEDLHSRKTLKPPRSIRITARSLKRENICATLADVGSPGNQERSRPGHRSPAAPFREQLRTSNSSSKNGLRSSCCAPKGSTRGTTPYTAFTRASHCPDRSSLDPPLLPDKITIFAEPLLEDFPDPEELREEIRLTVLHEIAHYFGMDEEEIEDLGY